MCYCTVRVYLYNMRQSDAIKVLDRWDLTGRYVYLKRDLRKLFHGEARDTFDDSLDRLVRSGILVRAARGVYVYRLTRHFSDATPDLIARNLRRGYLVYESLESALSMYGAISQIPVDRRTYMTTGRRGEYRTPYGVIEFTHTARTIDRIAPGLLHPEGRGVPVASKQLALRDLKATGRNLDLVDEQLMEDE